MILSYNTYIKTYIHGKGKDKLPAPGEHHFVSAYLVPKLFSINGKIPDYINPDGTKAILGDVVYYQDGRHHFGIEVKLGTVRLTKGEFNKWIVDTDTKYWPHLFIGIGHKGLALLSWSEFRDAYITSVQKNVPQWFPARIPRGYGPSKRVHELMKHLPPTAWFPWVIEELEAKKNESRFTDALRLSTSDFLSNLPT
jgi:hypothetical protein